MDDEKSFGKQITDEIIEKMLKEKKRKALYALLSLIFGIAGGALCVVWFGWKMFIVISILLYSNNLSRGSK